jgi:type VI secretion system protein ImpB
MNAGARRGLRSEQLKYGFQNAGFLSAQYGAANQQGGVSMTQEGSIAPKERVNIVYRPSTGDASEEVELPLKLMVLGDFTQSPDDRMVEDRDPVSIDKDNFNDVLKAQGLELNLNVPNRLSNEEDAQMAVNLKFNGLKDFEPDAIVQKVPELAKLMELREALKALKGPLANVPEFRRKVQELVKDEGARAKLLKELGIEE